MDCLIKGMGLVKKKIWMKRVEGRSWMVTNRISGSEKLDNNVGCGNTHTCNYAEENVWEEKNKERLPLV